MIKKYSGLRIGFGGLLRGICRDCYELGWITSVFRGGAKRDLGRIPKNYSGLLMCSGGC